MPRILSIDYGLKRTGIAVTDPLQIIATGLTTLHSKEPAIFLIACWESNKEREKELHNIYKQKRVRGEWFRLNMHDLQSLEKTMSQI